MFAHFGKKAADFDMKYREYIVALMAKYIYSVAYFSVDIDTINN
jgi:hypothetical protein